MSAYAAKNGAAPEDFSPQAFLISVAATSFEGRGFDPKMSYHRVFCMSPDGLWHFPAEEARRAAYEDLGAEALRKLYVEDMPLVVIIDSEGNNLYEEGRAAYLAQHK